MSVEFDRESPGKFDSRTLNRETLDKWTGRRVCKSLFSEAAAPGFQPDHAVRAALPWRLGYYMGSIPA